MCSSSKETQIHTNIEYTTTAISQETQCGVCHNIFDHSLNRIIIEACGHRKCRECLIKEVDGCSLCAQRQQNEEIEHVLPGAVNIKSSSDDTNESSTNVSQSLLTAENVQISNVIEFDGGYKCIICQRCFKSRNNRKYHQFCNTNQKKPLKCNQCDRQFITVAHLKYHQSVHDGVQKFPCRYCGKIYTRDTILKKHMRKHQNDRRYKCTECGESFVYKQQLNIHRNKHKNIYHKCTECDKRFLIKSNFKKHMQIHSGENRRTCSICHNSFSGSSALKTHMLTHSKSRTFQCTKCQKSFIDQRTLDRHSKIHIERHYECTVCSARSGRKDNIRRHVRNLHSNTEEDMDVIMKEIFDNFARKHEPKVTQQLSGIVSQKTDSDKNPVDNDIPGLNESDQVNRVAHKAAVETAVKYVDKVECIQPTNNVTSVIKFAGRAPSLNIPSTTIQIAASLDTPSTSNNHTAIATNQNIPSPTNNQQPNEQIEIRSMNNSPVARDTTTQITIDTVTPPTNDNDLDLTPINYKPLNYEPFPEIAPLPLLNTSSNLSVYRQLLSPYLKKPTNATAAAAASTATMNVKQPSKQTPVFVIDRPPKKMIEKYASLSKQ